MTGPPMNAHAAVEQAIEAACPVCGGRFAAFLPGTLAAAAAPEPYTIARMSYGTPFAVDRCPGCGLGRARVPYDRPEVLRVYGEAEDPAYPQEERARRATFRRGLERVRRALGPRPHPRLLDVGASVGFLLAEARELGFDPVGLEPSRWAAAEARRRFAVEVVESGLEQAGLPDASFDAVTLVDVLEHFTDPFAALGECRRLLRPGGILYVVTPDVASGAARMLGRRWWGFEPWHLWYFTARSLDRALVGAGLRALETRRYRRSFSLGYWLRKCEGLARWPFAPLAALAEWTGLGRLLVTVDLGDTLEATARRGDSA